MLKLKRVNGIVTWNNGDVDCVPEYMYDYGLSVIQRILSLPNKPASCLAIFFFIPALQSLLQQWRSSFLEGHSESRHKEQVTERLPDLAVWRSNPQGNLIWKAIRPCSLQSPQKQQAFP